VTHPRDLLSPANSRPVTVARRQLRHAVTLSPLLSPLRPVL
jgi:hypothetical protein